MSISEYPYEIHRTISHGCQFRNIHTKSTDRYPVDVNFGISIRNPQNDIPWMSISEYPYEIHGPISRGCPLWISIRNPQNDIPLMATSEYPYEIHRPISPGCQFRNIHTKSTERYPMDVNFGISIRNPRTDIPWMSPLDIHTKSTERYPMDRGSRAVLWRKNC